jgi:hypothetical protein
MTTTSEFKALPLIAPKPKVARADRRSQDRRQKISLVKTLVTGSRTGLKEADRRQSRERRATPRVQVELECEERVGPSRFYRITEDLSTFGLSTRHGHPHKLGTRVTLVIFLPDDHKNPIEVQAEVVGTYDEKGGMRLAFRKPSVEAVRRIHRYLMVRSSQR